MSTFKVTDRRRFDSEGKPRETEARKCRTCNGEGRVTTPERGDMPLAVGAIVFDGYGQPHKEPAPVCPQCNGRGTE